VPPPDDADELLQLLRTQGEEQALILLSSDGVCIAWMMGARRIFGRTADFMVGRTLHCLFTPEDQAAKVPENELATARQLGAGEDDRWMVRSDDVRFWASGFVQCLRAPDGGVRGFAKILRDRTDLRAQIDTQRNRAELLAEEDRRKVLVFGTLAHELRTPLSAVSNAVALIELAHPSDDKLAYALQVLKRQTSYVTSLIDDLHEVVRSRTGKATLRYASIPMHELLNDVVETIRGTTDEKDQQVSLVLPLVPVQLEGDVVRLRQIFLNLLQNAAKFSDRGKRIFVSCTVEDDEVVVRVEDQGRGIPPTVLPRVFDALTQADPAPQTFGLGLGLSLVKEYVELHGGSVQVRSEGLGRGSEFTVRLPLAPRVQASAAPQ
jgi:two-component system CheB/CheR fusion protein